MATDPQLKTFEQGLRPADSFSHGDARNSCTKPHEGMWASSVDLKDAYLHIPVETRSQNFLAFSYKGKTYKFVALPFGLSTSPRVFTRIAGAVVADLRRSGVTLYAYLDDWLVTGRSHQEALFNLDRTTNRLEQLGWVINREKSHLIPTQTIQFLGAILDFHTGWVRPSSERSPTPNKQLAAYSTGGPPRPDFG
ncbi:hypothetical protein BSL78_24866 [Apostichopus japonicus]|uniref:Reverse transcriptase domain-containing protein n=1 Tax=Stichopus japonicus TaxID=307972 RepID=A0A2G8JRA4_STIJA|nr:hypothetical protein BSL78_24866 [Apostichopus japonicus]